MNVCFREAERLFVVSQPVPDGVAPLEAALKALLVGPNEQEIAQGVYSAIPKGVTLNSVEVTDQEVSVDVSSALAGEGLDESKVELIFEQFRWTVESLGLPASVILTVDGAPISDLLEPPKPVGSRPKTPEIPQITIAGTALSGKEISLSPGHGYHWGGSGWSYDRPVYCSPLSREDHHNIDLSAYLDTYLAQDGATVRKYRCTNKSQGNDPYSNSPWWYMGGSYWIKQIGYPCSVYASVTGDCTLGAGADESDDNIRSRPLASNYDGANLHIAMHTNGYTGDCAGTGCPNGTATYYYGTGTYATVSQTFAQKIQAAVVDVIRTKYTDSTWRDRGYANDSGGFAETRVATRPAVLLELAFHDSCDRDGLYLRDNFFKSATMWAVYKGCCDYFGITPTYGFYSDDLVSDTIPPFITVGQTLNVGITFRNRGVLWSEARQFRLGAVGDSDPFASTTRSTMTGEVGPNVTYTFNLAFTAPSTPGTYTTDWRMVRDGIGWFGSTLTKQVEVLGEGSPIPATPTPTSTPPADMIIESRTGGKNYAMYSETGSWADSSANCTASGCTGNIGQRYGSTLRSSAGLKTAIFRPLLIADGTYNVYAAWGAGTNRRSPIIYNVFDANGKSAHSVDQAAAANVWSSLGQHTFFAGSAGYVQMTNEAIDVSGSMYAGAVMFEYASYPTPGPTNTPTLTPTPTQTPTVTSIEGNWIMFR